MCGTGSFTSTSSYTNSMWTSSMICWPLGVVKGSRLVLISPVFRQTWFLRHSHDRKYTNRQNTATVTPSAWFSPVHNSHPGRRFQHPVTQINRSINPSIKMITKTNQKMSEGADLFICEAKLNFNLFNLSYLFQQVKFVKLNWRF